MASTRINKVNELIRLELAKIVTREIEFPENTVVTIMRVQTDADIKRAKVFLGVTPPERASEALTCLKKRKPYIQHHLNRTLVMRYVPALTFAIEKEGAYLDEVDEVEHLLDTLQRGEI